LIPHARKLGLLLCQDIFSASGASPILCGIPLDLQIL
jgi:hypothetical protein